MAAMPGYSNGDVLRRDLLQREDRAAERVQEERQALQFMDFQWMRNPMERKQWFLDDTVVFKYHHCGSRRLCEWAMLGGGFGYETEDFSKPKPSSGPIGFLRVTRISALFSLGCFDWTVLEPCFKFM